MAAAEPPANLARRVAERESASEAERASYLYRQTVLLEEISDRGHKVGEYREAREILFTPEGERIERFDGKPSENLKRLRMTEEDFRDIREVQSVLFTAEQFWAYETKLKGEETVDGVACWVLQIRPRQILQGQRLFDGLLWVDQSDYTVVRSEGRAVPQMRSTHAAKENLFPLFTTLRERVGEHRFPVHTHADDLLDFSSGPQRIRLTIRYRGYRRFAAESRVVPEK